MGVDEDLAQNLDPYLCFIRGVCTYVISTNRPFVKSATKKIVFVLSTKTFVVSTQKNFLKETPKTYVKTDAKEIITILCSNILYI